MVPGSGQWTQGWIGVSSSCPMQGGGRSEEGVMIEQGHGIGGGSSRIRDAGVGPQVLKELVRRGESLPAVRVPGYPAAHVWPAQLMGV